MKYLNDEKTICTHGDYIYTLKEGGWSVKLNEKVTDRNQTTYGEILSEIDGEPVTYLPYTFMACKDLIDAPKIPESIKYIGGAFYGCTSLKVAPVIPNGVIDMPYTFEECTSLTTAPTIPSSVTDMNGTFEDCTSLTTAPTISNSVTDMYGTFNGCTSLTGEVEINASNLEPDFECFYGTEKPITLTGTSPYLNEIADWYDNVSIKRSRNEPSYDEER